MYKNSSIKQIINREFAVHAASRNEWLAVTLFYVIVVSLFPIAIGPLPRDLTWVAPGFIWVAVLLATILAQDSAFKVDYNNGIFEQMILSKFPFALALFVKIMVRWLVISLPLILLTPLLAISLGLPMHSIFMLCISLALGTLVLHFIGAIGAAITISLEQGGVLLALILLPLYIPVLVLGTGVGILSAQGIFSSGHLALLAALDIIAMFAAPLTIAAAIKVNLE